MKLRTTPAFREQLARLSQPVQQAARKAFRLWNTHPDHPSLQFKPVGKPLYSVRVGRRWRAVAMKGDDTFVWFFIGGHAEYDKLGKR